MTTILIKKKDTAGAPAPGDLTNAAGGAEIAVNTATKRIYTKDSGGTVVETGTNPSILNVDNIQIDVNTISSTDTNGNINLTPNGTGSVVISKLNVTGAITFDGNVTVGNSSSDTLTINSTITSNLIFTDNTYDIGASGATRPRNLFLAGNATIGGAQTLTGALTVDSTTDSSSTTTGSIQTDGGVGIAKALFVGTTASIAGVATFSAGSAAAPAITTTGDTNTGIWFPAADTIAFTEGGVESMRIDSAGNLGLGVTPSAWNTLTTMQIKNASFSGYGNHSYTMANAFYQTGWKYIASEYALQYYQNATNGQHTWNIAPSGTAGNAITFTQAMTLDADGDLGIGTSSPTVKLDIVGTASQITNGAGASGSRIRFETPASSGGSYIQMYKDLTPSYVAAIGTVLPGGSAASAMVFSDYQGSWAERMRITSAGDVVIGTTSAYGGAVFTVRKTTAATTGVQTVGAFYADSTGSTTTGYGSVLSLAAKCPNGNIFSAGIGATTSAAGSNVMDLSLYYNNGSLTEGLRIISTGDVGIGTSSPSGRLHVSASVAAPSFAAGAIAYLDNTNSASTADTRLVFRSTQTDGTRERAIIVGSLEGTSGGYLSFWTRPDGSGITEKVRITAAGYVGIGVSNPDQLLAFPDTIGIKMQLNGSNANGYQIAMASSVAGGDAMMKFTAGETGAGEIGWYNTTNLRMLLKSSGDLLIGTSSWSSGSNGISIGGNSNSRILITNSTDYGIEIYGATSSRMAFSSSDGSSTRVGSITVSTVLTTYNTTSDYRLKNVTGSLTGYKERLMSLQPKQGTWITDGSEFRGFVAHEFANPYRSSVSGEKDAVDADGKPVMQSMQASSSEVIADLVAMMQELNAKFDAYVASHP